MEEQLEWMSVPATTPGLALRLIQWGHEWPLVSLCISESLVRGLPWCPCLANWHWAEASKALRRPSTQGFGLRLVCESDVIGMFWGEKQSRNGDMMNGRDREGCSTGGDSEQEQGDNMLGYLIV